MLLLGAYIAKVELYQNVSSKITETECLSLRLRTGKVAVLPLEVSGPEDE